jgi:AraC family transcriptional regulator of adaptative response/methylated-DNA-[protein]-cysteine methyltransferase
LKSQLRSWLAGAEFQKLVAAVPAHNRIIGHLIALTFDADPLICWRAIDAIGRCAGLLSAIRPEAMKNSLRRLFWMVSDESGSVAWHAPEIIGEIIRSDPRAFADFIPMTISLLDMEPEDRPSFLPGILYALGRIGEAAPNSVDACLPSVFDALDDAEVQTRAMAICCLGRLKAWSLLIQRPELARDSGKALIYRDGEIVETTISLLLADALKKAGDASLFK